MTSRPLKRLSYLALPVLFWALPGAIAEEINVAVAANFAAPAQKIVDRFQAETGHRVELSLGSTSKLYAQVQHGAPFDIFLSADTKHPTRLVQEGLAISESRFTYAIGTLVLWSTKPHYVDPEGQVLRKGDFKRLALANPKLAPYGLAAQKTLQGQGLWQEMQDRIVMGENVGQTYQFIATGNAELGFIAMSQIINDTQVIAGSWWRVPDNLYPPILQDAVLLADVKEQAAAQAFLNYLQGPSAKEVILGYGYQVP